MDAGRAFAGILVLACIVAVYYESNKSKPTSTIDNPVVKPRIVEVPKPIEIAPLRVMEPPKVATPEPPKVVETEPEAPSEEEQCRLWTDATGKHKVMATFVKLEGDNLTLTTEDGSTIHLSLVKLSKEDKQWLTAKNPFESSTD